MAVIHTLHLHQFRNIQQACLTLSPGLNIVVGDNAAGKTAIIEALWVLASGRSFRTAKPQQLIRHDQAGLTLYCEVQSKGQLHKLGLQRQGKQLELRLNGENPRSQSELARHLPIQLLTPESHRLLEEGPKARRQFLDWGCFYHHREFMPNWRAYHRALKQRNQALKQRLAAPQIQLWDSALINAGEQINQYRQAYLNALTPHLLAFISELMPELNAPIDLRFYNGWPGNQPNQQACLTEQLNRDYQLGHTQYGPHRADIKFRIQQQEPLVGLSRGQQKLFVCALLLAQAQFLHQQTDDAVMMLIDDLPAELDQHHRSTLLTLLDKLGIQHLVTTTALSLIPHTQGKTTIFYLNQGVLTPNLEESNR
ncbi:MAG: DNA replication/repair protein RecF [Thiomicrospira sp.]|jgi:DNA replication and repair protein RecF|nr:DNA replication/repair protein RecF [Thiomicrospira sp.]